MIDYHIVGADFSDPYKNHQIVKSIFQGDGKVLFSEINNKLVVRTNIEKSKSKFFIIENDIAKKSIYQFNIKLSAHSRRLGKRIAFIDDKFDIENYVLGKLSDKGFNILFKNKLSLSSLNFIKKNLKVKVDFIEVIGLLEVTDIKKFEEVLSNGVGRYKMLGLGMLTVW